MCGRYALTDLKALVKDNRFQLEAFPPSLSPRYNIAPSQPVPAILNQAPQELQFVRWGLIPSWAKDPTIGYRMINARAETIAEKPAFRRPLQRQRCLIPADGFYEWQRLETRKVPHWITLTSGEVFAFAGLWDSWTDPKTNTAMTSCTIITTTPNKLLAPIHDRMPAILPRESETTWLSDGLNPEQACALLKPYPATRMKASPISTLVNSPSNDTPEVLRPELRVLRKTAHEL
ncbi:MAG: SOS response-associated peptidase [Candidatus Omnitrophota bacterium]|nr:SOS response-associated peptidase [Candidatus Omnitrophota bacterium]